MTANRGDRRHQYRAQARPRSLGYGVAGQGAWNGVAHASSSFRLDNCVYWPNTNNISPAKGTLAPIGSVPTEEQPRGFTIDPSGDYLLAVGQRSHALSSYRIDAASGQLTQLRRYPLGQNPNWVEIVELPSAA